MVTSTDDNVLRQDMPSALQKVESAAKLLEEAAKMSQVSSFQHPLDRKYVVICDEVISKVLSKGNIKVILKAT